MNALEIERAAIVKKIEAHGTIPTTTDDHRCNLKHWMPNPRTRNLKYSHKCDGGELSDLRKNWNKTNTKLLNELQAVDEKLRETGMYDNKWSNIHAIREIPKQTSYRKGTNFGALGFRKPEGAINIKSAGGSCVSGKCQFLCTNCSLSPQAQQWLSNNKASTFYTDSQYEMTDKQLREQKIINDAGDYVPFDKNWVDQFPELKRITPFAQNYYDSTPTRSEKEFQEELAKIRSSEPLQILNQVQHIEPETSETPIQEKSFIDKNKNYLIIGGMGIVALTLLILVVRK